MSMNKRHDEPEIADADFRRDRRQMTMAEIERVESQDTTWTPPADMTFESYNDMLRRQGGEYAELAARREKIAALMSTGMSYEEAAAVK